jgi:hypothetical protein
MHPTMSPFPFFENDEQEVLYRAAVTRNQEGYPRMGETLRVVSLTQTCTACPSQWEGRLSNGDYVYIRYRHGYLSLSTGPTPDEAVGGEDVFAEQIGGDFDGFMDLAEVATHAASVLDFSPVLPSGKPVVTSVRSTEGESER